MRLTRDVNAYEVLEELGAGSYGVALKVQHKKDERVLVFKRVVCENSEECQLALAEAEILSSLSHPNILAYEGVFEISEGGKPVVVMATEFCEGGTLLDVVRSEQELPEVQILSWIHQLAEALSYIHKRRILHRDLKPDNVLLDNGKVKLADFGLARTVTNQDTGLTECGTMHYYSPEKLQGKSYGAGDDMWALGIVLLELTTRTCISKLPGLLAARSPRQIADMCAKIGNNGYETSQRLAEALLSKQASHRPAADDVLLMLVDMSMAEIHLAESPLTRTRSPGAGGRLPLSNRSNTQDTPEARVGRTKAKACSTFSEGSENALHVCTTMLVSGKKKGQLCGRPAPCQYHA